jgi:hypothetical protein
MRNILQSTHDNPVLFFQTQSCNHILCTYLKWLSSWSTSRIRSSWPRSWVRLNLLPVLLHMYLPCWELPVDSVSSGQADKGEGRVHWVEGVRFLLRMAKQGMALQHTDFSCIAHWTQLHILMDRMGPLTSDFSSVTVISTFTFDFNYKNWFLKTISAYLKSADLIFSEQKR